MQHKHFQQVAEVIVVELIVADAVSRRMQVNNLASRRGWMRLWLGAPVRALKDEARAPQSDPDRLREIKHGGLASWRPGAPGRRRRAAHGGHDFTARFPLVVVLAGPRAGCMALPSQNCCRNEVTSMPETMSGSCHLRPHALSPHRRSVARQPNAIARSAVKNTDSG